MNMYKHVDLVKKANLYFDGKVSSRTFFLADGEKKTLGVMLPGEYEFGTGAKECMEILGGKAEVLLPGNQEWKLFQEGEVFEVHAHSKFQLKVTEALDYCCSYISE